MIEVKVIADSVSPTGGRLTTLQIKCHRYILAEINTHRVFSRSFRSSRAVPVAKMLQEVRECPAEPVQWLKNKPGMQATEPMTDAERHAAREAWLQAANEAAASAEEMARLGLHKQWSNRVVEPFLYVHGVITATDWDNFFELRCHPDAQPEFQVLACAMRDAMAASKPKELRFGQWHLPYVTEEDCGHGLTRLALARISAARCARVSYLTHEGTKPSIEADLALYERLAGSVPRHASPLEHAATPCDDDTSLWGNFTGWAQFRKMVEAGVAV